jgi:hypothetical protein
MMKKNIAIKGVVAAALALALMVPVSASAMNVERLVIGTAIEDREPVGVADSFGADVGRVYCFLEARNIETSTPVQFVWYFGENVMANVELTVGQGGRWRTYSSKNLAGLKGNWRVELQDAEKNVLGSVDFKVE